MIYEADPPNRLVSRPPYWTFDTMAECQYRAAWMRSVPNWVVICVPGKATGPLTR